MASPIQQQPIGRPHNCFRCNRFLGFRTTAGLKTETVILHPKQSFSCVKCKWRFESVSLAFAEVDAAEKKIADEKAAAEKAKKAAEDKAASEKAAAEEKAKQQAQKGKK